VKKCISLRAYLEYSKIGGSKNIAIFLWIVFNFGGRRKMMRKSYFLVVFVLVLLAVTGFLVYKSTTDVRSIQARLESTRLMQKEVEKRQRENIKNRNRQLGNNLIYFEDIKTGLCFAIVWIGTSNGGPAMSEVDCTKKGVRELIDNGTGTIPYQ
jgi:hypothetical protein